MSECLHAMDALVKVDGVLTSHNLVGDILLLTLSLGLIGHLLQQIN